ncbi:MAG: hypothetical protein H0X41_00850 [Chitinophagaceae bacterium]|nr:hypothetical protein [Chitinophagaceae bacterium]
MKEFFLDALNLITIAMWGYAAFSKLYVFNNFRFQLLGHPMLLSHATFFAGLVPILEIVIACLLIFPITRKAGALASLSLLILFTMYILYMFGFYPHQPCSCGGIISRLSWSQHILFNMLFIFISFLLSVRKNRIYAKEF